MADHSMRTMLDRFADGASDEFVLPTAESFRSRRRARRRATLTIALSICLVLTVSGVALALSIHRTATKQPAVQHPAPAVVPHSVTVHQLRNYRWSALPAAPIGRRFGAVSVWTGSQMIVWGGRSDGRLHADGAAYAPATRTWSSVPAAPLSPRYNADAVWTGSRLIIADGSHGATQLTDGAMYDPSTSTWTRMAAVPPVSRGGPARFSVPISMFWSGNRAVRLSLDKAFAATQLQAVAFDPATNSWTGLPPLKFAPVNNYTGVTAAIVGGRFVVWVSSEGSFALDGDSWHRVGYAPSETGCIYRVIPTAQSIIYPADWNSVSCGGDIPYTPGTQGDVLDLRTGKVSKIPYTTTSDAGAQAVWTGGALLNAAAAATHEHTFSGDILRVAAGATAAWAPGSKRWIRLASAPAGGGSATWQWTGQELLGYGSFGKAGSGLEFGR